MSPQEITGHFRVWVLLSLLGIFTILLSDRFQVSSKLDRIYKACTAYNIEIKDLDFKAGQ